MKTFKMLALVTTFSFVITGVCHAGISSGHSIHPCGGSSGHSGVGYDSHGAHVCVKGPYKGKSAR
jgi:hypothetical protein